MEKQVMSRSLRPRKSKPSYASLAGYDFGEDETGAGPSKQAIEDVDSGSDFAPEKQNERSAEEDEDEEAVVEEDEDAMSVVSEDRKAVVSTRKSIAKGKGKSRTKTTREAAKKTSLGGPTLSGLSKRQMYVLPTPSVHHRHRAVPIYSRPGRVERLVSPPSLFKPDKTTLTNGFTRDAKVMDWVNKAWGYNVGWGPLWELVEDRGWYKEAVESGPDVDAEENRRPRVYANISVKSGWKLLSEAEGTKYLPTDVATTEEGNLKPPPAVSCYFGPFDKQVRVELNMFEALKMGDFMPENTSHVFNAGGPVWGLDWCPIHPDDRQTRSFKQYLAVAPFPTTSHSPEIGARVKRPSYSCIQIWSLCPTRPPDDNERTLDPGEMRCEMVLCLDTGPAFEVKWCPLPAHDDRTDTRRPRKLGILAGTFEDGSLSIFAIPDPEDVAPRAHTDLQPVYVRLSDPLIGIELPETNCWSIDWANSELIAVGMTNGVIAVYDVGPQLKHLNDPSSSTVTDMLPTHYLTVHQSAIRALAWIKAPPSTPSGAPCTTDDPTVIASGGYDGVECMTDIREGHGTVMNRTRDVINSMCFSPYAGGPITIDHENIVKAYSASPSMLGRGHTLMDPNGPVWSISASEYHPQLAVGSADGICATTNTLRSTRRGGSVPFFVHKIFQLDYNRKSGVYRMLERFLPQEMQERPTPGKAKETGKANALGSTGAWSQQVGVHRVVWNSANGLGAAGLLASATASGLCRVDDLWGRWMKNKVPYGGIERIRGESERGEGAAMDVGGDSDDSVD